MVSSQFRVSSQSEGSKVRRVCCALLSWWPTMPDSCLGQARRLATITDPPKLGPNLQMLINCGMSWEFNLLVLAHEQHHCLEIGLNCWTIIIFSSLIVCSSCRSEKMNFFPLQFYTFFPQLVAFFPTLVTFFPFSIFRVQG